jgi:hypothetical protein
MEAASNAQNSDDIELKADDLIGVLVDSWFKEPADDKTLLNSCSSFGEESDPLISRPSRCIRFSL